MVFNKLNELDKEQIAIFKTEHGTTLTSSVRALVMRGSTFTDASELILSREAAKAELLKEMEKADSYGDLKDAPTAEIQPTPKKPRAPRKAKTVVDKSELKVVSDEKPEEGDYRHMKINLPKPKKEVKPKAKPKAVDAVDDSGNINILL